jgi:hypothetical protein
MKTVLVRDLKKALRDVPDDLPVQVSDGEGGFVWADGASVEVLKTQQRVVCGGPLAPIGTAVFVIR